jgi:putative FmdB family regulatory protein
MPTYEYECNPENEGCGHTFEESSKMNGPVRRKCPECGKLKLRRLFGIPGLIFKGSGWTPKFGSTDQGG